MQNAQQATSTTKPTVKYVRDSLEFHVYEGKTIYAKVMTVDHPHLGSAEVATSTVIKQNDDGSFETRNTIYVPTDEIILVDCGDHLLPDGHHAWIAAGRTTLRLKHVKNAQGNRVLEVEFYKTGQEMDDPFHTIGIEDDIDNPDTDEPQTHDESALAAKAMITALFGEEAGQEFLAAVSAASDEQE